MNGLAAVSLVALSLYLALLAVKLRLSLRAIRAEAAEAAAWQAGQITIVQPILGGDPRLEEVLRMTLENTPQATRFLWLVDREDAAGQAAVRAAGEKWSDRIEIVWCDRAAETVNPKLHKLELAWPRIKTPIVAVLDDDTTISERNLRVAVSALDRCDLYTGIPCYQSAGRFWDSLVTHFVNNNSVMTYLSLVPLVGPLSINGMFYVLRTSLIAELGGFAPIRTRLCDDYAVARLLLDGGRRIHQGVVPQYLYTTVTGTRHYVQLMHRWFLFAGLLVRDQRPATGLLLLVLLGIPPLLLWAGLIGASAVGLAPFAGQADPRLALTVVVALCGTLVLRHGAIALLHRKLMDRKVPLRPAISLLSELLQPLHWFHSVLCREIQWRTRRIRVKGDNTFYILDAGTHDLSRASS